MRILVLGGDGYLGWAQALYLSARGHEITIVDNLSRRAFDQQVGFSSLLPIESLEQRIRLWRQISDRSIRLELIDVTNYAELARVFGEATPEAVVHYGQQPSAPYSMIDRDHAVDTQVNNLVGTLNVLFCIKEIVPECHLVKLGTMGEYGTPNIDIEEGFIEIKHKGRTDRLPFPKQAGSFYHLSKVHDSDNILFCCRVWGLRATDLNQGIVYGAVTDETALDGGLTTRFNYDHLYGTALNRFCVQAVAGVPITVYGEGGQTRGWIDIRDTIRCIELAVLNPPAGGEFRVFNQITEEFPVFEIAERVSTAARRRGHRTEIVHVPNPRVEKEQHYYNVVHHRLEDLGLRPHLLSDDTLDELIELIERHRDRIDVSVMTPTVDWRQPRNRIDAPSPVVA